MWGFFLRNAERSRPNAWATNPQSAYPAPGPVRAAAVPQDFSPGYS